MMLSNCCDAPRWLETDLCSECKEWSEFWDDEEEDGEKILDELF